MKLFEISDAITQIMATVESQDGELSDVQTVALDSLELARDQKLLDCACVYKSLEAEAEAVKATEIALGLRRKALERHAEWLWRYIRSHVTDGERLKDGRAKLGWRKSSAVEIVNVQHVPDKFMRYNEPAPDKTAIKAAIESGEAVPGAQIVERQNLQIS
jgi:hypothetical protein